MTERIKAHLDSLLQDAPKTRRVEEMRQELLAGCLDKYADLTAGGMNQEEAYREVIEGIGDVHELLGHIERINTFDPKAAEEMRRKRATFTVAGISLFIIGIIAGIVSSTLWFADELSGILLLAFFGAGVIVLIYGRMIYSVKYEKVEDTIVEDIKVQMTQGKKKQNSLAGLASSSMWCVIVVLYFLYSFLSYDWHISWIIFIIGAAIQCCMTAVFYPERRRKSFGGAFWCVVVVIYFIVSFQTFAWHLTWVVFPLAVASHQAVRFYLAWRDEQ